MKRNFFICSIGLAIFFISPIVFADILTVPGQYATIQSAINAAANAGDTVLVADGTYSGSGNKDLDPLGKRVAIMSASGPESCIIDCENSGRGFYIHSSETNNTLIQGFSIINGYVEGKGGAIYTYASPRISNCIIRNNIATEYGGGILFEGPPDIQMTPILEDSSVHDNYSAISGGGLSCLSSSESPTGMALARSSRLAGEAGGSRASGPSVLVSGSKIYGNKAGNGAGIYCNSSNLNITRCTITANDGTGAGGGVASVNGSSLSVEQSYLVGNQSDDGAAVYIDDGSDSSFYNSLIAGNIAEFSTGGISASYSPLVVVNCTLADNSGGYESGSISHQSTSTLTLFNNIFSGNHDYAIMIYDWDGDFSWQDNLYWNNSVGDVRIRYEETFTGPYEIDSNLAFSQGSFSGDPLYVHGTSGLWTADPVYDSTSNRTTFYHNAGFAAGELTGRFFKPDSTARQAGYIESNTETTIVAIGELTGTVVSGTEFILLDYHLSDGSAALDRADLLTTLENDIDGDARPGSDLLYDTGCDEAPAEYLPPPDTEDPESYVLALPEFFNEQVIDLPYFFYDANSGVVFVELFYRFEGGAWTQYPGTFTESPISFDSGQTGGDGFYEFYTIATDGAGNVEDPPVDPDAFTQIISSFPAPRVCVDIDASGEGTGVDWENATNSIEYAIGICTQFDVSDVWVAEGTYSEDLTLASNIMIYGGFAGTEDSLEQRDYLLHETIIDVSQVNQGYPAPVAVTIDSVENVWLDGFTIRGADSSSGTGSGILCQNVGKDCTVINCLITENTSFQGGGFYCEAASNSIYNCRIIDNTALESGGGIYCAYLSDVSSNSGEKLDTRASGTSPYVANSIITANAASYGGGIYCDGRSIPEITNCDVIGNTADQHGGGIYSGALPGMEQMSGANRDPRASGPNPVIVNTRIAGNSALSGGGIAVKNGAPAITNCLISYNSATMGGGIIGNDFTEWQLRNSIIAYNTNFGILDEGLDSLADTTNCLLHGNTPGEYYYAPSDTQYTDVNLVNIEVPGAFANRSGDPLFVMGMTGNWSVDPVFDPETYRTILTDTAAAYIPGELQMQFIQVNLNDPCQQFYIESNTETEIVVIGDAASISAMGDTYRMIDYHLQDGSCAIDRAVVEYVPVVDMDNDSRPGSDGLSDIGPDEVPSDFIPSPDTNAPMSTLVNVPVLHASSPTLQLNYIATDTESGVQYVNLFYRIDHGDWQQYPGEFTSGTIDFNSGITVTGFVELYTIAVDNENNMESAPAQPDAGIYFILMFDHDRIYVDSDSDGLQTGESWATALNSLNAAVQLAYSYSVNEIWVAEGLYPEPLTVTSEVALFGSFQGTESSIDDRQFDAPTSIIDTSMYSDTFSVDITTTDPVTLDGFTVQHSVNYALHNSISNQLTTLSMCHFTGNAKGVLDLECSTQVYKCQFVNNSGPVVNSGNTSNESAEVFIVDCLIQNNSSGVQPIINNPNIKFNLINCLIMDNNTEVNYQPIVYMAEYSTMVNCTVVNNTTIDQPAVELIDNSLGVNCIIRDNEPSNLVLENSSMMYSNIEGSTPDPSDIDLDPLFVTGPNGEYYLSHIDAGQSETSPCVDSGVDLASEICFDYLGGNSCMSDFTTRIDHAPDSNVVDMGYHYLDENFVPATFTPTPPYTFTATPTFTPTPPNTFTATPTMTPTNTHPAFTNTPTFTPTHVVTPSVTPSPTFTPVPNTSTPTFTTVPSTSTPTPTPTTGGCDELGVKIFMPDHLFKPGSKCSCIVSICNNQQDAITENPLFVILAIENSYFFAPLFTQGMSYYSQTFPAGSSQVVVLDEFEWPEGAGKYSGAGWYAALTDPAITTLLGNYDYFEFGWEE